MTKQPKLLKLEFSLREEFRIIASTGYVPTHPRFPYFFLPENSCNLACKGITPPVPLSKNLHAGHGILLFKHISYVGRKDTNMSNRTRQNELKIFLSDDENFILEEKYKLSGMRSRSAFIRHLILYGYVYDVDYSDLREYNTLLSKIGNNLNQITKRANTTGHLYDEDMNEVKELMNQVWHTQKSMLSKQPSIKQ